MKQKIFFCLVFVGMMLISAHISAQSSIVITSPNTGDDFNAGDEIEFVWDHTPAVPGISLQLYMFNDGLGWIPASEDVFSSDDASYLYAVPNAIPATDYQFRIQDPTGTIVSEVITLTLNESVYAEIDGTDYTTMDDVVFTWHHTTGITMLQVMMSTDGGSTFTETISEPFAAALGTYTLNIPAEAGTDTYHMVLVSIEPNVQSNVVIANVTDDDFAEIRELNPAHLSNVAADLSGLDAPGMLMATFEEAIEIVGGKTIHLKSNDTDPVTDIQLSTDNSSLVFVDSENPNALVLDVSASLPLENGASYYVEMGGDVITDIAGNAFAGFSDSWSFTVSESYSISGQVAYDGTTEGDLFVLLYTVDDWIENDFSNPAGAVIDLDPSFPRDYVMENLGNDDYVLFAFMDYNGDGQYNDGDEPVDIDIEVTIDGANLTGLNVYLEEEVSVTGDFVLDITASSYTHPIEGEGTFTAREGGYFVTPTLNGLTAKTMNSFEEAPDLFGMGFWIEENEGGQNNEEDELGGSMLDAGTVLHLEYTYSTVREINFVSVGGTVTGCSIVKGAEENRLILDIVVVDPVRSASGDYNACCGISISCDPAHTGGVSAYGSVFYADLYTHDMGMTVTSTSDMIGSRINGENGYEGHLTALISDEFPCACFGNKQRPNANYK